MYLLWALKILAIGMLNYKRRMGQVPRPSKDQTKGQALDGVWGGAKPLVCVQIPVYNEPSHIKGILESVVRLDWPREQLEIQVLDDSTDNTTQIAIQTIRQILRRHPDLNIEHIRRPTREGFKAGALNHGMAESGAEYFCIFDCDFRPNVDFLTRVMPRFTGEKNQDVAAVQAVWSYSNGRQNLLTRMQTMLLNVHFLLEHFGRFHRNLAFNFNGTAGVWRREALEDLGQWCSHSVTEDLLLSFRAQMGRWRLGYASDVTCTSELPDSLGAFLIQQRRWAKGNGQVLRLLGRQIMACRRWRPLKRLDALVHLTGYGATTLLLLGMALSPVWIQARAQWISQTQAMDPLRLIDLSLWTGLLISFLGLFSSRKVHVGLRQERLSRFSNGILLFMLAPVFACLLVTHYWQGVFRNPVGKQLIFNRTPKGVLVGQMNAADIFLLLGVGSFTAMCAGYAWYLGSYVTALLLVVQTLMTITLVFFVERGLWWNGWEAWKTGKNGATPTEALDAGSRVITDG